MARRRFPAVCVKCGGAGLSNGVKTLKDGTRKRRHKCEVCGHHWLVIISLPPVKMGRARFNGLTMCWRGYWYSYGEQARIRESARMGGLL